MDVCIQCMDGCFQAVVGDIASKWYHVGFVVIEKLNPTGNKFICHHKMNSIMKVCVYEVKLLKTSLHYNLFCF